jgi:hypothetical protein
LTAHSTPAALSASSLRMLGKAAMIAVLLAPTASIAKHDDHSTAAKPIRWFNVALVLGRPRADDGAHGAACMRPYSCRSILLGGSAL